MAKKPPYFQLSFKDSDRPLFDEGRKLAGDSGRLPSYAEYIRDAEARYRAAM